MSSQTQSATAEDPKLHDADLTRGMEHMRPYVSVSADQRVPAGFRARPRGVVGEGGAGSGGVEGDRAGAVIGEGNRSRGVLGDGRGNGFIEENDDVAVEGDRGSVSGARSMCECKECGVKKGGAGGESCRGRGEVRDGEDGEDGDGTMNGAVACESCRGLEGVRNGEHGESTTYGIPNNLIQPQRDPNAIIPTENNPQSRRDPFQFGTRYLAPESSIFSYNAWDHVDPMADAPYQNFATQMLSLQRSAPVRDAALLSKTYDAPEKAWDKFYKNNAARFFKDRKWLFHEFPTLAEVSKEDAGDVRVVEVGAGAGNTVLPLMRQNQNQKLSVHALDFSQKAVKVMRESEEFKVVGSGGLQGHVRADVWDLAGSEIPPGFRDDEDDDVEGEPHGTGEHSEPFPADGSTSPSQQPLNSRTTLPQSRQPPPQKQADIILLIFTFSALSPSQWPQALHNIHQLLKPGGVVLFRDYGRGDLAQIRFRQNKWLEENFYVRGDGTRVYFFGEEELGSLFCGDDDHANDDKERSDEPRRNSNDGCGISPSNGDAAPRDVKKVDASSDTSAHIALTHSGVNYSDPSHRPRFERVRLATDRRMLVNRKRKLKMYRCWLQGVFRKSATSTSI